jgi:membrane-anchored protein YejM (alkaline phosphatase superfamily)
LLKETSESKMPGRNASGKGGACASGSGEAARRPWASAARAALPWAVPAVLSLYIKRYMMTGGRGFAVVARYIGRTEGTASTGLTRWEEFSFFRGDLLLGFVLIPLALILLSRYLPRRWRALVVAAFSAVVAIGLYVQLRALEEVGRYVSWPMFRVALSWGWHEPGANAAYLSSKGFLVLLGGVAFIAGSWWWGARRDLEAVRQAALQSRWQIAGPMVGVALVLAATLSWLPRFPTTPYHESVLLGAFRAFWHESEVDTTEFASLSVPELLERYRELTHAPPSRKDPRYWAKARGSNLIFFILETVSTRYLPPDDNLADFPNLRRLHDRSFIPLHHYTTYPYTNRALFSLFSSWYPPSGMMSYERRYPDTLVPGIFRILSSEGYHTANYNPVWYGRSDHAMFDSLGIQQQVFPDAASLPSVNLGAGQPAWKGIRIARDLAALHVLEGDLDRWLTAKKHFAVAFLPQVGHAPWPDAEEDGDEREYVKRARAVLAMQDAWLGQLLDLLERHAQLERTLIVVTGDHGIRTRLEDPGLPGGTIDEESFHVPLLLYAPQALEHTQTIPWMTSHIDVQPTLLDLLGEEKGREFEQGAPLWNPDLAKRTTYFFARHTFGADGYYSDGEFYMWNQMSGSVYANARPRFDPSDLVPRNAPAFSVVPRSIERMVGLQQVWVTQFGRPTPLPGR